MTSTGSGRLCTSSFNPSCFSIALTKEMEPDGSDASPVGPAAALPNCDAGAGFTSPKLPDGSRAPCLFDCLTLGWHSKQHRVYEGTSGDKLGWVATCHGRLFEDGVWERSRPDEKGIETSKRNCFAHSQLTKRARLSRETERFRSKWQSVARVCRQSGCRKSGESGSFREYWPFPPGLADAPSTRTSRVS